MRSVEHVLSSWVDSLNTPRADEMGRRGQRWRTWVKQVLPGSELRYDPFVGLQNSELALEVLV